jgi:hypothetical protein
VAAPFHFGVQSLFADQIVADLAVPFEKVLSSELTAREDFILSYRDFELDQPPVNCLSRIGTVVRNDEEAFMPPAQGFNCGRPADLDPALFPLVEDSIKVEEE